MSAWWASVDPLPGVVCNVLLGSTPNQLPWSRGQGAVCWVWAISAFLKLLRLWQQSCVGAGGGQWPVWALWTPCTVVWALAKACDRAASYCMTAVYWLSGFLVRRLPIPCTFMLFWACFCLSEDGWWVAALFSTVTFSIVENMVQNNHSFKVSVSQMLFQVSHVKIDRLPRKS